MSQRLAVQFDKDGGGELAGALGLCVETMLDARDQILLGRLPTRLI
jgi:hypothetical protein